MAGAKGRPGGNTQARLAQRQPRKARFLLKRGEGRVLVGIRRLMHTQRMVIGEHDIAEHMKTHPWFVWSIGLSVFLVGCAAGRTDAVLLNPGVHYSPREAGEPVVLTTSELEHPYVEVGMIHVSGISREGYQGLNEKLRSEARRMGADAVIFVRYGTENLFSLVPIFVAIPYDVLTADGVAVRSK